MSSTPRRRSHILSAVLATAVMTVALAAILAFVWYPTTLQPNIVLSNAEYTTAACIPYGTTGFANRYDWTFTLTNSGQADGSASVRFGLGEYGLFNSYFVPRGSQVQATGLFYGAVHPTASECTGPENPTLSLVSFGRVPPIDDRNFLGVLSNAVGTVAFSALLLGLLAVAQRRRGLSLFSERGAAAWLQAILLVTAAGLFSSALGQAVLTVSNAPVNWTATLVFGSGFVAVGLFLVCIVFRVALEPTPGRVGSATDPRS